MTQTPYPMKNKVEIILDVFHFDLPPRMAIILPIHSLYITKMAVWIINEGIAKKMSTLNANIKLGTFLIHNVLLFCFFNSKSGIGGKRHYPEMIHDIKKKNGEP
jgi:hypothetical protein